MFQERDRNCFVRRLVTLSVGVSSLVLMSCASSSDGSHVPSTLDAGPPEAGAADSGVVCTPRAVATGKAPGSNYLMPGAQRVRTAISSDGQTWTRTGVTVGDQLATPSFVLSPTGRPMLYMMGAGVLGGRDGAVVSIASDDGASFTHCLLELVGYPRGLDGADPDVVQLSDGTYRMFVTGPVGGGLMGIHYANSADGLTWTYGGTAFSHTNTVVDSVTLRIGEGWHMYTLSGESAAMAHGVSSDGMTFRFADQSPHTIDGKDHILSHAAIVEGTLRIFAFGPRGQDIRSFSTQDGATLVGESKSLLSLGGAPADETEFVKDPAVVRLKDGRYLMAYSTGIP